eukprot:5047763-Pyramimonas_sp.AAC.1
MRRRQILAGHLGEPARGPEGGVAPGHLPSFCSDREVLRFAGQLVGDRGMLRVTRHASREKSMRETPFTDEKAVER